METEKIPPGQSSDDAGEPDAGTVIIPKDLVRKARSLGHEALVESICHALQFIDEPEVAVRSLISRIQHHARQDALAAGRSPSAGSRTGRRRK